MERRVVLAVLLMFATVIVVNLLFPPPPPTRAPAGAEPAETATTGTEPATRAPRPEGVLPPSAVPAPEPAPAETVAVVTPLLDLRFVTRGGALVRAALPRYESLAEGRRREPVQVVKPGEAILAARWVVGQDTIDLGAVPFTPNVPRLELAEGSEPATLEFEYAHPSAPFGVHLAYTFAPDRYLVEVHGTVRGAGGGWWVLDLGTGLRNNEADAKENRENLAIVVNGPRGIESVRFREIEPGTTRLLDGPHRWAAIRDKYFLLAVLAPDETAPLGGLLARAGAERYQAHVVVTAPVTRAGTFRYRVYLGPQDTPQLARIGAGLQDVNPYGWAFLRPLIRPLARGITALLLWARDALGIGYGWILVLFGIGVRVVLFPLYQSTMRSQMRMAELQPALQEIQARYRSDPARMQQELMKLYREKGMTPLTPLTSGCLPMLLPFPFLIALFFVFRDTIEFRGAHFLWMPDLSRPDPYYVVPVLMGLSMFALSWLGQRAVSQTNPQMKILMYVMPAMMTIFFLALPAGLNVYYFAMNVASIPQQLYLNRERRRLAEERKQKEKQKERAGT